MVIIRTFIQCWKLSGLSRKYLILGSLDRLVGVCWGGQGSILGNSNKSFCSPKYPDLIWSHRARCWIYTGKFFGGLKRPGRDADHWLPTISEFKKTVNTLNLPLRDFVISHGQEQVYLIECYTPTNALSIQ